MKNIKIRFSTLLLIVPLVASCGESMTTLRNRALETIENMNEWSRKGTVTTYLDVVDEGAIIEEGSSVDFDELEYINYEMYNSLDGNYKIYQQVSYDRDNSTLYIINFNEFSGTNTIAKEQLDYNAAKNDFMELANDNKWTYIFDNTLHTLKESLNNSEFDYYHGDNEGGSTYVLKDEKNHMFRYQPENEYIFYVVDGGADFVGNNDDQTTAVILDNFEITNSFLDLATKNNVSIEEFLSNIEQYNFDTN